MRNQTGQVRQKYVLLARIFLIRVCGLNSAHSVHSSNVVLAERRLEKWTKHLSRKCTLWWNLMMSCERTWGVAQCHATSFRRLESLIPWGWNSKVALNWYLLDDLKKTMQIYCSCDIVKAVHSKTFIRSFGKRHFFERNEWKLHVS